MISQRISTRRTELDDLESSDQDNIEMDEIVIPSPTPQTRARNKAKLALMDPVVFTGIWALLGTRFALQEWLNYRRWGYHIRIAIEVESWGMEFVIWGALSWVMWGLLGAFIQSANLGTLLLRSLPVSFAADVVKEMLFVMLFPGLPLNRAQVPYWTRFRFHLTANIVDDMVVLGCSLLLFRGLGYYQKSRDSETAAALLEVQLANARLSTLRIQLNLHFVFNAMNSISSLMRADVDVADEMFEQLSSLLRISLKRGSAQLIPLHDEIEFIEVYLSMQDRRDSDRIRRLVSVDPELHDFLVSAMILQPIVENACAHGLSKVERDGELFTEVSAMMDDAVITVTNSCNGIGRSPPNSGGHGVGIENTRCRPQLLHAKNWSLRIVQTDPFHVRVAITIPVRLSRAPRETVAKVGAG